MKVAVLIPVHCHYETIFTTVGTWLQNKVHTYDATLAISLHENYDELAPDDLKQIKEQLLPKTKIVEVQEINWSSQHDPMRYSRMHARTLMELLKTVPDDADYVAIFDHDLCFYRDFIAWALCRADVITAWMGDSDKNNTFDAFGWGGEVSFKPKPAGWHILLSARAARKWRENPEFVEPCEAPGRVIYDTMSRAFEATEEWGMTREIVEEDEIKRLVTHEWSLSLNFGMVSDPKHADKVRRIKEAYHKNFPNGIKYLIEDQLQQHP